jgi:hypothetical protein
MAWIFLEIRTLPSILILTLHPTILLPLPLPLYLFTILSFTPFFHSISLCNAASNYTLHSTLRQQFTIKSVPNVCLDPCISRSCMIKTVLTLCWVRLDYEHVLYKDRFDVYVTNTGDIMIRIVFNSIA